MKNLLILLFSVIGLNTVFAQNSYIQVNGEPNLSVYLNNEFKGITTAEFNGYIIENVSAGTHRIKIVKKGYAPFEENISVKAKEVFAYKVKPFVKHTVTISEQGNSGVTENQAKLPTGKLVIQSVPIEIKISIPSIEGIRNMPKTKDEWLADDIPEGSYDIELSFGNKIVKERINIVEGNTTNVFVNMINGEFKASDIIAERNQKERAAKYLEELREKYKFKVGLSVDEFFKLNPEASTSLKRMRFQGRVFYVAKDILNKKTQNAGSKSFDVDGDGSVKNYAFCISRFGDYESADRARQEILTKIKAETNLAFVRASSGDGIVISPVGSKPMISYIIHEAYDKKYELDILFRNE
ncbi:PEGA domain-containing protein [Pedobacter faecalis]|uniref:PEGA domain-containing protein n=1 Tax=Pedobacter faecalis TaxID=3041495 RepID=UPI00254C503A|nr:PEGA domain-containing protein [Pedobacter sp. ELA7]